jgi:hypothetical protein
MPTGKYDPNFASKIAEGSANRSAEIKYHIKDPLPTFFRAVVLDVISDPTIISDTKIEYWKNVIGISNSRFAKILPRNSIIAQRILTGQTSFSQPMFLLPFFPSHLSLPCKAGEMIWAMFEDPNAKLKEMGYWFCRIAEPHFIDDVNHTHHPRQFDHSFHPDVKSKMEKKDDPVYELRNGKVDRSSDGSRNTDHTSRVIPYSSEEIFEILSTETDSSRMSQYESVPRFRKRPGDVALEGSNNSLIVLGTDRMGPVAKYNRELFEFLIPLSTQDLTGSAGCVDIVAGRGSLKRTGGTVASVKKILDGEELKKELGKSEKEIELEEGDPDFLNDRSRVLVSQRTMVDKNFSLSGSLEGMNIKDDPNGDAGIIIKSDKVRIIARSDISFIVTNYSTTSSLDGSSSIKIDNQDVAQFASITIRQNGDIIFTPSSSGFIKLGGDGADRAILCTSVPAVAEQGTVGSTPIATTAGGFVGSANANFDLAATQGLSTPDLGTFSTKVLVTGG